MDATCFLWNRPWNILVSSSVQTAVVIQPCFSARYGNVQENSNSTGHVSWRFNYTRINYVLENISRLALIYKRTKSSSENPNFIGSISFQSVVLEAWHSQIVGFLTEACFAPCTSTRWYARRKFKTSASEFLDRIISLNLAPLSNTLTHSRSSWDN